MAAPAEVKVHTAVIALAAPIAQLAVMAARRVEVALVARPGTVAPAVIAVVAG